MHLTREKPRLLQLLQARAGGRQLLEPLRELISDAVRVGFAHGAPFFACTLLMSLRLPYVAGLSMLAASLWSLFLAVFRARPDDHMLFYSPYLNIAANAFYLYLSLSRQRAAAAHNDLFDIH
jgi:hypothetical protein